MLAAALVAIYVLIFRGLFGKTLRRGSTKVAGGFFGKSFREVNRKNPDGPAWASALMGGFAAVAIASVLPDANWVVLACAAIVGVSCGIPNSTPRAVLLSLPGIMVAGFATVVTCLELILSAQRNGSDGALVGAAMLGLFALAEIGHIGPVRSVLRMKHRKLPKAADRAIAYFAAADMITFLVAPGGVDVLSITTRLPAGVLWALVAVAPVVFGGLHVNFLHLFNAGVALSTLLLAFAGVPGLSFLASMELLAASMIGYWITRWLVRGFGGVGLLAD